MKGQIMKVLGVLVCITGAFLMFNGSILGERTVSIATVIGIIGILIISTSKKYQTQYEIKNRIQFCLSMMRALCTYTCNQHMVMVNLCVLLFAHTQNKQKVRS